MNSSQYSTAVEALAVSVSALAIVLCLCAIVGLKHVKALDGFSHQLSRFLRWATKVSPTLPGTRQSDIDEAALTTADTIKTEELRASRGAIPSDPLDSENEEEIIP